MQVEPRAGCYVGAVPSPVPTEVCRLVVLGDRASPSQQLVERDDVHVADGAAYGFRQVPAGATFTAPRTLRLCASLSRSRSPATWSSATTSGTRSPGTLMLSKTREEGNYAPEVLVRPGGRYRRPWPHSPGVRPVGEGVAALAEATG